MFSIADKILPHLIGGGDGVQDTVAEGCLVVGFDNGMFQLISLGFSGDHRQWVQENVIAREGWNEFLEAVMEEFGKTFVQDISMIPTTLLESVHDETAAQDELRQRAKNALAELNECNRILYRAGITTITKVHESSMMSGSGGLQYIDIKHMKELK